MLTALTIRDIVLIEHATLEFGPGLNVLTGETGAGKTILLDSLGFVLGRRGRAAVRAGMMQGSVTALFEPGPKHLLHALLEQHGLAAAEAILLRRSLTSDGRSRAFVNDEALGVGLLKQIGEILLEVHGQNDDQQLFDVATHRLLLDEFGALGAQAKAVADRHSQWMQAREQNEQLARESARVKAEAEYVRLATAELCAFDPKEGEERELAGERTVMMNSARILEELSSALELIAGERGGQIQLAQALKKLSRLEDSARRLARAAENSLEQACALAEEAGREIENLLSRLDSDPTELERKEERLFALRALARKYSVAPDDLPKLRHELMAKLDLMAKGEGDIAKAQEKLATARQLYLTDAGELSRARERCARRLENAVLGELAALKLAHARFRVHIQPLEADDGAASGLERISFEVETVKGSGFGPLTRIASGGELARFSLALKVALAQLASPLALVFDEVDRGVGGAVADAVGERLQRLAANSQVLLVTHSPQVAARAERHFRITRVRDKTLIQVLNPEERVEEIARMLSGSNISDEARAQARRLISEANQPPSKKSRKRA